MDHIATPAMPPANITAPRLRSEGEDPAGVIAFLTTSYPKKYLNAVRKKMRIHYQR